MWGQARHWFIIMPQNVSRFFTTTHEFLCCPAVRVGVVNAARRVQCDGWAKHVLCVEIKTGSTADWRIEELLTVSWAFFTSSIKLARYPGGAKNAQKKETTDPRNCSSKRASYTDSNFRILVPTFVPPNNPENKSSPWTTSTTNRWKKLKQQKTAKLRSVRVRKEIQQLSLPIFSSPTSFCPAIAAFYRIKRGFPAVRTSDAINEIFHRM